MKKILLTFACLLLLFVAWVFPYIDELRDQGLTLETAYGYFFEYPKAKPSTNNRFKGLGDNEG